ncbi:MAG: sugar phosphate isomerase/epimerase family protein [Ruminiclostridium sp.]
MQNYEIKNERIKAAFIELKKKHPDNFKKKLNLSWSNWGFGIETLAESAARLQKAGIKYIELHGNHYGADLGYKVNETLKTLKEYNIEVAGVCGMFSTYYDMSSTNPMQRQAAIDYIRREVEFAAAVGGKYLLVVPGAVGRPHAYNNTEFERSIDTLRIVADLFSKSNIKAAIEPVRSAEVSFVHTIAEAKAYIKAVNHPGIGHINGDVFHMQSEESHIGEAIVDAGDYLVNLHLADSNRCALGEGAMDVDTIIMALYLIGYNTEGRYATPEPLGPGGDPYPAMYGNSDKKLLDNLVNQTASYFRERENALLLL